MYKNTIIHSAYQELESDHGTGIPQTVVQSGTSRFKTNAEWLAEAETLAQQDYERRVHRLTIERLHALHSQIIDQFNGAKEQDLSLVQEYAALAGLE